MDMSRPHGGWILYFFDLAGELLGLQHLVLWEYFLFFRSISLRGRRKFVLLWRIIRNGGLRDGRSEDDIRP